jgi:hypothetical protein
MTIEQGEVPDEFFSLPSFRGGLRFHRRPNPESMFLFHLGQKLDSGFCAVRSPGMTRDFAVSRRQP